MTLAEVRLKKLSDLIRELKAGRDALMREGNVDAAKNISNKISELEQAQRTLMREIQLQAELKRVTTEAKQVRDTYIRPDMSLNVSDLSHGVGNVPMQVGTPPPIGQQKARKKKRKTKKRGR